MSIDITLTDKQGNEINYNANSMLSSLLFRYCHK